MTIRKKLIVAALSALAGSAAVSAQSLWTEAEASKRLCRGLSASVELEHRTTDGVDGTARWAAGASVDYKVLKPLKLSLGYSFIMQHEEQRTTRTGKIVDSYWQPKHRGYFAVTGSYSVGHVGLSLRERYQYTYRTAKNVDKFLSDGVTPHGHEWVSGKSRHALRSRLQVEYNIRKKCPFTPYVSCEVYNDLADGMRATQWRYTAGCDYRFNKHHSVGLSYRYIDKSDDDEVSGHVIGIGYSFKF